MQNQNTDNTDFYNTNVPPKLLEDRNDFIVKRWTHLGQFYLKYSDEMIKYLLYVNAGGAVTSIGFLGAFEEVRNSICLRISLCFFAVGLTFVGILRASIVHKIRNLHNNWRKDVEKYWKSDIGFTKLTENDDKRTESDLYAFILGYISGGAFVLGLIFGGISLFSFLIAAKKI